jgi:hypothetical protein
MYGNRGNNNQVNLSQPSNELANEVFTNMMMQAVPKCCDVLVKHKKEPSSSLPKALANDPKKDNEEADKDNKGKQDEEQERKAQMLKPQNVKDALITSKIQLK